MSNEPGVSIDSDWAVVIGIVILVIFCAGDPDLLDAIIHNLMNNCSGGEAK